MAEGLIVRDAAGSSPSATRPRSRSSGCSRDRLRGRRPGDVLGAAVDERGEPLTGGQLLGDRALTDGASESGIVARVTRPDGTAAWVSTSSGPVRDAAGRHEGVVTSLSDITSRREAEQRLVASERATRTLAEEQSALRRIATLVAAEAPPQALFEQVTEEVGRLLGVPSARVVRYEDDGRATIVGGWTEDGDGLPVGSSVPLDGETVLARVRRSGRAGAHRGLRGHRRRAGGAAARAGLPRVGGRAGPRGRQGVGRAGGLGPRPPRPRRGGRAAPVRLRRAGGPGAGERRRARDARRLAGAHRRGRRRRAAPPGAQPPRRGPAAPGGAGGPAAAHPGGHR